VRSEDCVHQVLPKSLEREPMDNATFRAWFSGIMPLLKGFTVTVHEVVESKEEKKVMMWASSVADSPIGPYKNEYCLILFFNETGDKLVKFLEFVDSKWSTEFFAKMREWVAEQAKAKRKAEKKARKSGIFVPADSPAVSEAGPKMADRDISTPIKRPDIFKGLKADDKSSASPKFSFSPNTPKKNDFATTMARLRAAEKQRMEDEIVQKEAAEAAE